MASKREKIQDKALELLEAAPLGIRYSDLVRAVQAATGEKVNTVHGAVWDLDKAHATAVTKPSKGLFLAAKFVATATPIPAASVVATQQTAPPTAPPQLPGVQEADLYEPFADYLMNDLEECTKAIPLGGSVFKDKWGTPDVIGKYEAQRSDIIKQPTEIVAAEIKSDTAALITAFGQACAYKLFCHRVYIVVPADAPQDDLAKLDMLGRTLGIGVITWSKVQAGGFRFDIKVRAAKSEPDFFYMNRNLKLIESKLFG